MDVEDLSALVELKKRKVQERLVDPSSLGVSARKTIIGRYRSTFRNFSKWLAIGYGQTTLDTVEDILLPNMLDELGAFVQHHRTMLDVWAEAAGGDLIEETSWSAPYTTLLAEGNPTKTLASLYGFEALAPTFLPWLDQLATLCGSSQRTYIEHHLDNDPAHAKDLATAALLQKEDLGALDAYIEQGIQAAGDLLYQTLQS